MMLCDEVLVGPQIRDRLGECAVFELLKVSRRQFLDKFAALDLLECCRDFLGRRSVFGCEFPVSALPGEHVARSADQVLVGRTAMESIDDAAAPDPGLGRDDQCSPAFREMDADIVDADQQAGLRWRFRWPFANPGLLGRMFAVRKPFGKAGVCPATQAAHVPPALPAYDL